MSDSESEYSHAAAVRSRAERNKKDEDWGDSVPELDRQRSEVTQVTFQQLTLILKIGRLVYPNLRRTNQGQK